MSDTLALTKKRISTFDLTPFVPATESRCDAEMFVESSVMGILMEGGNERTVGIVALDCLIFHFVCVNLALVVHI